MGPGHSLGPAAGIAVLTAAKKPLHVDLPKRCPACCAYLLGTTQERRHHGRYGAPPMGAEPLNAGLRPVCRPVSVITLGRVYRDGRAVVATEQHRSARGFGVRSVRCRRPKPRCISPSWTQQSRVFLAHTSVRAPTWTAVPLLALSQIHLAHHVAIPYQDAEHIGVALRADAA